MQKAKWLNFQGRTLIRTRATQLRISRGRGRPPKVRGQYPVSGVGNTWKSLFNGLTEDSKVYGPLKGQYLCCVCYQLHHSTVIAGHYKRLSRSEIAEPRKLRRGSERTRWGGSDLASGLKAQLFEQSVEGKAERNAEWTTKQLTRLRNRPKQTEYGGGQAWDKRVVESVWEKSGRTDNPFLLRGRMEIWGNEAGQLESRTVQAE
ncbi:hypothetical protein B0H16DRAFT_1476528 [Mycena metata]|uniref:Uncharacterized protein n=1 Tax=Mycena metata TaxID=1033252 RepID=A0AAD7HB67_9AGAR|nr:hypothetical protein B0H16DRAFT_1476528 [Mycena metata]